MKFKTLEVLNEYNRKAYESIFSKILFCKVKVLDTDNLSYSERIIAISFKFDIIPINKYFLN